MAVNGKQVLVLVPTTILAEQHFNTFRERYRDFPVRVEMVSRFVAPKDTKPALTDFSAGKVDVLIGTHRVLSRDVIPKELGLVILDEEQRFGVAQKELLKSLRLEVDVLTLTRHADPAHAPPLARRHARHLDHRDAARRPPPDPDDGRGVRRGARQARARARGERDGQAFFLHNRVETIEERAAQLQQLCPKLRFLVAHGQMRGEGARGADARVPPRRRGRARLDDDHRVGHRHPAGEHAHRRALRHARPRQLYQIRGRVGRSDATAYAYLFYPDARELTDEARARLSTLADHTELGAGFAIAMRDLEIRGAGELLGAEQSGHVAAVGFELYVELLNEAVAEMQGQKRIAARPVRVDARVDAYVPSAYVDSEALRIDVHRRLALAETEDELRELQLALEDRFGPLPEPVENLFRIQEARIKVALLGADYLVFQGGKATVGRLVLGSGELRELRDRAKTAIYASSNQEVSMRGQEELGQAVALVDAILDARRAA